MTYQKVILKLKFHHNLIRSIFSQPYDSFNCESKFCPDTNFHTFFPSQGTRYPHRLDDGLYILIFNILNIWRTEKFEFISNTNSFLFVYIWCIHKYNPGLLMMALLISKFFRYDYCIAIMLSINIQWSSQCPRQL